MICAFHKGGYEIIAIQITTTIITIFTSIVTTLVITIISMI